MNLLIHLVFGLGIFHLAVNAAEVTEPSTQLAFPTVVQVLDQGKEVPLQLTGIAVRSKFFVNVYALAHYMQDPAKFSQAAVFDEILRNRKIKQFVLKWVHDVDLKSIREAYLTGFQKSLSADEQLHAKKAIDTYLALYTSGAKVGDVHILRWFPDGIVTLTINDQPIGKITDPLFAKGLWGIWFNPKSVVSRNKLVKNLLD
ncbi:MAG: hypothetical protein CK425_04260 [Parachlamydia sp.]|nr:MAG: hypothetical protein CK425_04260 [Parachlamydia sp.]